MTQPVPQELIDRLEALISKTRGETKSVNSFIRQLERASSHTHYPNSQWSNPAGNPITIKNDSNPKYTVAWEFKLSDIPILESVAEKLENHFNNPEFSIQFGQELQKIIDLKWKEFGMPKLIKESADAIVSAQYSGTIIEGMRAHAKFFPPKDFTVAQVGPNVFIYQMTEEEAVKKVSAIVAPVRRTAPEKVAIKMITLRLIKLQQVIKERNEASKHTHGGPNQYADISDIPCDRKELIKFCWDLHAHPWFQYYLKPHTVKLLEVISRHEITDEVLELGFNALKISQVHGE